jgi:hypothetical protein
MNMMKKKSGNNPTRNSLKKYLQINLTTEVKEQYENYKTLKKGNKEDI